MYVFLRLDVCTPDVRAEFKNEAALYLTLPELSVFHLDIF